MSYAYFLPSVILNKDVVELKNVYRRARMIRDTERLSSKNGLERAPSISRDMRGIEESERSLFSSKTRTKGFQIRLAVDKTKPRSVSSHNA